VSDYDLIEKAFIGLGGGGAAVLGLFKLMSVIKKEQAGQAGDGAIAEQFKALKEQINQCNMDNHVLRQQFTAMDAKVHKQQRTITRMEMLLRQFSTLMQDNLVPVPKHMTDELASLIITTEQQQAAVDAFQRRRSTDV
jgi:hypothetical protein